MRLDVGTVLVQWSAGGLLGLWVTSRRRVVGIGYGWLLRGIFATLAAVGAAAGLADPSGGTAALVRDAAGLAMAAGALVALAASVRHRRAGPAGPGGFDPRLDLVAPAFGVVALLAGAAATGGPYPLSAGRLLAGALLLGFVTDAMLLGHWYLVQPGLSREPIKELVALSALAWPLDVALLLAPTGMVDVLSGRIDDGYGGLLAALWVLSAATTLVLLGVTWRALAEPYYSAVMASTGLLYLAILTTFGTDVLARALFTR
jgi:hypothetical protein